MNDAALAGVNAPALFLTSIRKLPGSAASALPSQNLYGSNKMQISKLLIPSCFFLEYLSRELTEAITIFIPLL